MKYKAPDIKTADAFFEIFSDPQKILKYLEEIRAIRSTIMEGLGVTDTKAKADTLLRLAGIKMAEAEAYDSRVRAGCDEISVKMAADVDKHEAAMVEEREQIAAEREQLSEAVAEGREHLLAGQERLSAEKTQSTRTMAALKKDLEARIEKVAKREGAAGAAEVELAKREKDHAEYVKRVKAAV